jgi:hypothetical protein
MTQKGDFLQPKLTFAEFGIKAMLLKSLKNNPQMFSMFIFGLGINEDIIDEYHDKRVKLFH